MDTNIDPVWETVCGGMKTSKEFSGIILVEIGVQIDGNKLAFRQAFDKNDHEQRRGEPFSELMDYMVHRLEVAIELKKKKMQND